MGFLVAFKAALHLRTARITTRSGRRPQAFPLVPKDERRADLPSLTRCEDFA
jgi:hypothetical protein